MNDSPYAPLRRPAVRDLLLGRGLSVLGVAMLNVAVGWKIYAMTGDPLDLGLVGLVQFLPHLALFPVAGIAVDRLDRTRVLSACYAGYFLSALALAWLSARGVSSPGPLYAVLAFSAISRVFRGPAGSAMLPALTPVDEFARAASWSSSVFTAATVAGPALGGGVYALAEHAGHSGAVATFGASAALLAVAWALTLRMPPTRATHRGEPPGFGEALDGVRYILSRPLLLGAITLDLFAVLFGGAVALLPIFAADILHTGPVGLGLLRAAPAVGALLTALALAHRPIRHHTGLVLLGAVGLFGAATLGFALSTSFWLSLAMLAITGAADEVSVFIRVQIVQLATPDALRGRVGAAEFVFIGASNELGELESGLTASWWGAVPAVAFGGAASLAVVALFLALFPTLRSLDRIEVLKEEG